MPFGVLDQIAGHAAQQCAVAGRDNRLPADAALLVPGAFLGRECKQIDLFAVVQPADCVEPTREQDLIDELIQLGNIPFQLALAPGIGGLLQKFHAEPDAREAFSVHAMHWLAAACASPPVPRSAQRRD